MLRLDDTTRGIPMPSTVKLSVVEIEVGKKVRKAGSRQRVSIKRTGYEKV